MNESKPIPEHVFGGYPHSRETVFAQADPNTTYAMLSDNLKWQLGARQKSTLLLKIDPHSRSGQKRIQRLIKQGWNVEQVTARIWRRKSYLFTRPLVTPDEADFLGWNKK